MNEAGDRFKHVMNLSGTLHIRCTSTNGAYAREYTMLVTDRSPRSDLSSASNLFMAVPEWGK